jgi:hypothetical protein
MAGQNIMNIAELKKLLSEVENEVGNDYQVWLSSDEEGNEFLPMSEKPEFCLMIEKKAKRIIFFLLHR